MAASDPSGGKQPPARITRLDGLERPSNHADLPLLSAAVIFLLAGLPARFAGFLPNSLSARASIPEAKEAARAARRIASEMQDFVHITGRVPHCLVARA